MLAGIFRPNADGSCGWCAIASDTDSNEDNGENGESSDIREPSETQEKSDSSSDNRSDNSEEEIPWRGFLAKVIVSICVFLLVSLCLERYVGHQVEMFSRYLVNNMGYSGLFMFVFFADGVPQPLPYVPLIFLSIKGGMPKLFVFGTCAVASYSAAICGYWVGFNLRDLACGKRMFEYIAKARPWLPDLMQRRGAVGVLIAALLPAPLALATWTAGSFRTGFFYFLFAAAGRVPKILLFVLICPAPKHGAST